MKKQVSAYPIEDRALAEKIGRRFLELARERRLPEEAMRRLGSPLGESTFDLMIELVRHDWALGEACGADIASLASDYELLPKDHHRVEINPQEKRPEVTYLLKRGLQRAAQSVLNMPWKNRKQIATIQTDAQVFFVKRLDGAGRQPSDLLRIRADRGYRHATFDEALRFASECRARSLWANRILIAGTMARARRMVYAALLTRSSNHRDWRMQNVVVDYEAYSPSRPRNISAQAVLLVRL